MPGDRRSPGRAAHRVQNRDLTVGSSGGSDGSAMTDSQDSSSQDSSGEDSSGQDSSTAEPSLTPFHTLFHTAAATDFLATLRDSPATGAGDLLAGALRVVVQGRGELAADDAGRALVAIALLVAERDPSVLDDVPEADGLREWLADLDTELTPARRQAAEAVLRRVALPDDNAWLGQTGGDGDGGDAGTEAALAPVQRLT